MSYRDEYYDSKDEVYVEMRNKAYMYAKRRFEGLTLEEKVNELIEIYAMNEKLKITI